MPIIITGVSTSSCRYYLAQVMSLLSSTCEPDTPGTGGPSESAATSNKGATSVPMDLK